MSEFLQEYLDRGFPASWLLTTNSMKVVTVHKEETHKIVVAGKGKRFVKRIVDRRKFPP